MGNSNSTDTTVKIYLETAKPMYTCGELVEGTVKIVARTHLPYQLLHLKLQCFQFCKWLKHNAGVINELRYQNFMNHNRVFQHLYDLGEFPGGLRMGFYSFPFALKLPMDLPGSLLAGQANIKYVLSTYLTTTRELAVGPGTGALPYASSFLNVTEPPRFVNSQQTLMDAVEPFAFCCCSQGHSQTTATFTSNIAKAGDIISVGVFNDNRACQVPVAGTKLSLVNNIYIQSKNGKAHRQRRVINEKMVGGTVLPQGVSNVQTNIEVPKDLPNSTVIGYGVASYYTIEVESQMRKWCCSSNEGPVVSEHIYLKALNPLVQQQQPQEPLPLDWAPQVAMRRVFNEPSLAGFMVNPKIGVMNRAYPLSTTAF